MFTALPRRNTQKIGGTFIIVYTHLLFTHAAATAATAPAPRISGRDRVIHEIIETERKYVESLRFAQALIYFFFIVA